MLLSYFCRVKIVIVGLLLMVQVYCYAQETDFPLDHPAYRTIDKWQSLNKQHQFSSFKPYSRTLTLSADGNNDLKWRLEFVDIDRREYLEDSLVFLRNKPIWNTLYKYQGDFFSYQNENLDLHIDPFWQFDIGGESGYGRPLYTNSRGLSIRGTLDNKIAFFTSLAENQVEYPTYVKDVADSIGVIPYEGFWKEFSNKSTTDFLRAFGYIDFPVTPHISGQLGFGRHFIGHGEKSLLLSDFSNSYPYVRFDTQFWRFKLTSIYAQLTANVETFDGGTLGSRRYPRKIMLSHYLDLSITESLNIGLFESLISGAPDSLGGTQLKLEHLNPVIFYRAVEQQDGSNDNIILGLDANWTPIKGVSLYGQFVLDELIISELVASDNWWGNKYGYQLGLNMYDWIIPGTDIRLEHNVVRPFTYAHDNLFTSYTHYLQPLAHPMGANFSEFLATVRYQPVKRLQLETTILSANYGVDRPSDEFTFGRNPAISYNLRDGNYGHNQGQGIRTDLFMAYLIASYEVSHDLYLDVQGTFRNESFDRAYGDRRASIIQVGFRWNTFRRRFLF